MHVCVVRLDGERKTQIGFGIFMTAIHFRGFRQGGKFSERGVHLFRGAFKESSATGGEQRISAKHHTGAEKSNVSGGVSGDVEHVEFESELGQFNVITVFEPIGDGRNAFARRAVYRKKGVMFKNIFHAPHVIGMMVGAENSHGGQMPLVYFSQNRLGIAGINDGDLVG